MELWAISDIHVGFKENWNALQALRPHADAALVLAGDVGETTAQLAATLDVVTSRFARVVWCPGNHDLWQIKPDGARGVAKYDELIETCRRRGVLTPEDDYPVWELTTGRFVIAPLFLLYDYSFAPDHVLPQHAVAWAAEAGLRCADEELLHADPYPSREAWCAERCDITERRLEAARDSHGLPMVLINHFPLKRALAQLPAIPRFRVWCGTRRTEDWHTRFRAAVVISGHLHIRNTTWLDGCRFEEVSLGYPRQWRVPRGIEPYLRRIDGGA
jgi:predicted phosphodiesterase